MEVEPLPSSARSLLEAEKRVERPPSPETLARVWRRVGETTTPAVAAATVLTTGKLVSMFLLGTLGGIGGTLLTQHMLAAPPAATTTVPAPVAAPVPAVPPLPVLPSRKELPKPSPGPRPAPVPKEVSATVASDDSRLADEQAILEVGRSALVQRRGEAALEAVARHRAQHPHGQLAEERDALEVQALAQLGRTAEARERAAAFRRAFPSSIFLPAIDELGASP